MPILRDIIADTGFTSIVFILSWYLKNDLRVDIFRLMVFEVILFSFRAASHERTTDAEISANSNELYCKTTKSKNPVRSFS